MIIRIPLRCDILKKEDNFRSGFHFSSFVKLKVSIGLLHIGSVTLLKVLRQYHISVFANCMHSCLLTNSCHKSFSIKTKRRDTQNKNVIVTTTKSLFQIGKISASCPERYLDVFFFFLMSMSFSSIGTSFLCRKVEGEVMGSSPTGCVTYKLKKKNRNLVVFIRK